MHWGATSQDMIDTALSLELRAAIDALLLDLDVAIKGFIALAGRHRRTLTVARTLLQHALPMPFGLEACGLCRGAGALARPAARLRQRGAGAAVRRRGRHAGGARRPRLRRCRADRGAARPAGAGRALAQPPRPACRSRRRVRDPRRHLRQDRARRGADDADRGRRSLRAAHRRPRRLLDAAAQAQPSPRPRRSSAASHRAQSRRHHFRRAGPGARARGRRLADRMDDIPGARAGHVGRAARRRRHRRRARDRRRARCATTSS